MLQRNVSPLVLALLVTIAGNLFAAEVPVPENVYNTACATCHGLDGKGRSPIEVAFPTPLPDFSDCEFTSREPDADWFNIIHQGGPVRGFNRMMPAFGEALSEEDIFAALAQVRTFCDDKSWPPGEFNLPRALFTEKAFPEDEAVSTTTINLDGNGSVMSKLLYEKRFGPRSMIELALPIGFRETGPDEDWDAGIGDLSIGLKHNLYHDLSKGSIFSAGVELILPTGDEDDGFGKGTAVLEPFLTYGKILPGDAFFQAHAFAEFPRDNDFEDEAGLRFAVGKTWTEGRFGRAWSPMIETLFIRDLVSGAKTNIDIVPQFQVSLNTRQHILFNVGVRVPANNRDDRDAELVFYVLWDWFDGGLMDGW